MNLRDPATVALAPPVAAPPASAPPRLAAPPSTEARVGVAYAVAAYGLWGVFPLYFKLVVHVPALEVLAHRIIWSLAFLVGLMLLRRNARGVFVALRDRRTLVTLTITTLLIATNWFLFIWAVTHDLVLQASLGYFINPLVSVLLGFLFLRERLRRLQTLAVGLAGLGVGYLTVLGGQFPGLALYLACSFGLYGLLRKIARVDALAGLTVETGLLTPLALGFLVTQMVRGQAVFGASSVGMSLLLVLAGVVTATPLLWFAEAARRLRLATLGFLQYLAPTGHFLLAVLAFGEPFTRAHLVTFACIWTALAIYSIDTVKGARRAPAVTTPTVE